MAKTPKELAEQPPIGMKPDGSIVFLKPGEPIPGLKVILDDGTEVDSKDVPPEALTDEEDLDDISDLDDSLAGDSVGDIRLLAIDSALAGLTAQVAAMADVIAGLKATPAPQQQPPIINVTIDNKAKTTKTATLKRGADGNLTAVVTESNDED